MANLTKIKSHENGRQEVSWEHIYDDIWESDEPITDEDVEKLEMEEYHMFPIVKSSFRVSDDRLTVVATITVDSCD